jgi:hypothetical protein
VTTPAIDPPIITPPELVPGVLVAGYDADGVRITPTWEAATDRLDAEWAVPEGETWTIHYVAVWDGADRWGTLPIRSTPTVARGGTLLTIFVPHTGTDRSWR